MNKTARAFIAFLATMSLSTLLTTSRAARPDDRRQDPAALRQLVEQFLTTQTAGLPGRAAIKVNRIDTRVRLAACAAPQAFLPGGSRAWGRTTVGLRCDEPSHWTIYVQANVQVMADYLATARPLAQGQEISEQDLVKIQGDLTTLPSGIITDAAAALGRSLTISLPSGMPLRQDVLRSRQVVQQGQTIKLIGTGPGFRVSSEARALNNAMEGQVAQARTPSGQVVSGIAKAGGMVEVAY